MIKSGIDQDALVDMFSKATATQGEALRKAVADATLKAFQGRELTLANIRSVLKTVTAAATTGTAQSGLPMPDVEALLQQVFAGMDSALLKAVDANRLALEQFVRQGVDLQDKQLKGALANLEKLEDLFFDSVSKAAQGAAVPMKGPWDQVLGAMKVQGTDTGAQAAQTVQSLTEQARTALRDQRAAGAKAMQAMLDGYAALVSGVLLGMSEGLQGMSADEDDAPKARTRKR
jgi:hypothetical protein